MEDLDFRTKLECIFQVFRYRPFFACSLMFLSAGVALLQGIGLSFIYPIFQVEQSGTQAGGALMNIFVSVYEFLGVSFNLENLIIGVSLVMTFRYSTSFMVSYLQTLLSKDYESYLRKKAFRSALNGKIHYFDREGSDNILNHIITETGYSGKVINRSVSIMGKTFLIIVYISVMAYISPVLTVLAMTLLGGITLLLRRVVEPAVSVGNKVAEANEEVQRSVQAGTQGIRDVKLFGMGEKVYSEFEDALEDYVRNEVKLTRNEKGISNFYNIVAALTLFSLIYIGFAHSDLALGELGIFLVAMLQLAPKVSRLNSKIYKLEGHISHLVRTQEFLDELSEIEENSGDREVSNIDKIDFRNVNFSYVEERVLEDISLEVEKGDFIAFVGQSGAGKSTIVSLMARMYEPDSGEITSKGVPVEEFQLEDWRSRISVVRQQAFIFNTTLKENVKIGRPDASREEVQKVCKAARVDEFLDELPNGYETELGDDGIKLSGGQRQRVAIARALLKDSDFLILDEATSDLDSNLEKQVHSAIENMDREYGIIAIAHRLSTVQNADTIHTLENGEITERGTHEELLEQEGKYQELYSTQNKKDKN